MKVYLDNNIFVAIENKEINLDAFWNISNNYSYVYSYAHIQELMEAKSNLEELKIMRLKTILDLTNNSYVYPDNNQICLKTENPENVILFLNRYKSLMDTIRQAINNFNIDRDKLISILDIDIKRINNYSSNEVIEYINNAINNRLFIGLNYMIDSSGTSLRDRINTLFNLLDFVGFWKDKKTERSNLARMYDSSHTYFASFCDLFVSEDDRARNKAKVSYELYSIDTEVLSFEEFLKYDK